MTAPTTTAMSAHEGDRRAATAFRHALGAEWVRLWSVRSTWWSLAAATAMMGVFASTFVYEAVEETGTSTGSIVAAGQFGMALAEYGLLLIALLAVTGEFSTGAVRTGLQWMPQRGSFIAARCAVTVTVTTAAAVLLVLVTDLGLWALAGPSIPMVTPTIGELAASLGRVAVAVAGSTCLTVGLAFALRNAAGTLTTVFLLLFVLPAALGDRSAAWLRTLASHLPGSAVVSLLDLTTLVGDGRATAILGAWGAAAIGIGVWTFHRRDA